METRLARSAFAWTLLGLASGLYYRELTRQTGFTGATQLSVAHTHALALGATILLVVLALTRVFRLDADRRFRFFPVFWDAGLALTFGMLVTKGTAQVLGLGWADSKALAGVSGLGHMVLAGTLILLLLVVLRAVKVAAPSAPAAAPEATASAHVAA